MEYLINRTSARCIDDLQQARTKKLANNMSRKAIIWIAAIVMIVVAVATATAFGSMAVRPAVEEPAAELLPAVSEAPVEDTGEGSNETEKTVPADSTSSQETEMGESVSSGVDVSSETEQIDEVAAVPEPAFWTVPVSPIMQGTYDCEATALSMLLACYDPSIEYWEVTSASAAYSRWSSNQYGGMLYITVPSIVELANEMLVSHGNAPSAYDLSGCSFDDLVHRLVTGDPALVIYSTSTTYVRYPYVVATDGGISVYDDTHAVVLCGYDESASAVMIADPAAGSVYWLDAGVFEEIWLLHGGYAMGIQ